MKDTMFYEDNSNQWCKNIPSNWEEVPCRVIFTEQHNINYELKYDKILSIKKDAGVYECDMHQHDLPQESMTKYTLAQKNDFILHKQKASVGELGVSKCSGLISQTHLVLSLKEDLNVTYYSYIFKITNVQHLLKRYTRGTRETLDFDSFKHMIFPRPSMKEQKEIADFLDDKNQKIDHLISKKQQLIKLCEQQKTGLINEVIPQCLTTKLKFLGEFTRNINNSDIVIIIIRASNHMENLGKASFYPSDIDNDSSSNLYLGVRLSYDVNPHYLVHFINSDETQSFIKANNNISYSSSIRTELIENLIISLPPKIEQDKIVKYMDNNIERINDSIKKIHLQIETLQQYKNSLINAAVTGKLTL